MEHSHKHDGTRGDSEPDRMAKIGGEEQKRSREVRGGKLKGEDKKTGWWEDQWKNWRWKGKKERNEIGQEEDGTTGGVEDECEALWAAF